MNKKLIVANWKMLPETVAQAREILDSTNDFFETIGDKKELSLVLCPPFVFIEEVSKTLKTSHLEHEAFLGAQDIAIEDKAALTGEVSGPMLNKMGVRYVIIGHSERRWVLGETDDMVNKKVKSAIRNEMTPIVCIGERERDGDFKMFLEQQVKRSFEGLSSEDVGKCIIAYEPVWAISTNPNSRPDTPESALESISTIKSILSSRYMQSESTAPLFLYGGSINSRNASDFLKQPEIDGVLVGGASVNKEEFIRVLRIASQL